MGEAIRENEEQRERLGLEKLDLEDPNDWEKAKRTYCLRALYGDRRPHKDAFWHRGCRRNAVHGADAKDAAKREIALIEKHLKLQGLDWSAPEDRRRLAQEFSFPDCSDCAGTGRIGIFDSRCHPCFGTGKTRD